MGKRVSERPHEERVLPDDQPPAVSASSEDFEGEERPSEPLNEYVCRRVRELRRSRGWTLEQLAARSHVSRSMLSQIERGTANPTLGVAYRIAQAFGVTVGELVDLPPSGSRIDVVRGADPQAQFRDDQDCRIRTLSPLQLEKDVEFYELTLKPGGSLRSAPHFADTREFLTIEKGSARIVSGDEQTVLEQGDSAHYPADVPHQIENTFRGTTIAFLVVIYTTRPSS
jgi:transcriptional regulator with XRE-family HTH domain